MIESRTSAIYKKLVSTFFEGLREAERNAFCDITRQGVAGGLLFAGLAATTGAGVAGGLFVAGLSAVAYAAYCGRPPTGDFYSAPDWDGGQCDGIPYRVNVTLALILSPKGSNVPVGDIGDVFDAVGAIRIIEVYDTGDQDNDIRLRAVWKGGSKDVSFVKGNNNDPDNPQWGYDNVRIVVTRNDGLPDLCGNPAPTAPPLRPGDNVYPTNITYNNENNVEVTVPITFTFGFPRVDIRGEINMPVNIKLDLDIPININGSTNFNTGDFTINVNPPGGSPAGDDPNPPVVLPPGTDPVPPDVPIPDPEPPEDDPITNKRKIIKAVIVTVIGNDAEATKIIQGENPDIYAPALGYVQFFVNVGGTGGWTSDIPVKNKRNFIPCPWILGATAVRGSARNTAILSLKPIYTEETYNPQFPPEAVIP